MLAVSSLKHITFIIHICLAPDTFKLGRFHVAKNNVRVQWFQLNQNGITYFAELQIII